MATYELTAFEQIALYAVVAVALLGLIYALWLRREVLSKDKGNQAMIEVWDAIRTGADAYLSRQLRTILPLIVLLTVALFLSVYVVKPTEEAMSRFAGMDEGTIRLYIGLGRAVAFVMGAGFSLIVGQFGMRMAVQGNVRVAAASQRSFGEALRVAYRSGTITGMLTDGLGLFGGTVIFLVFVQAAPDALLGFGFGGTLLALFMRVGGGIYTKAADVGADLVGKVEAGLPEDDPRNAAVVADLVGDNVGDCAGMAADIFESYEVTIVSGLILGLALVRITGDMKWIVFPLLVRGIGVLSSIIGTFCVAEIPGKPGAAMDAIFRGFLTSAGISVVLFGIVAALYMGEWRAWLSTTVGVGLAILIDRLTEYFTAVEKPPVQEIARQTQGGPATTIISGLAIGYESSVWQILVIAATIVITIVIWAGEPLAMTNGVMDPVKQVTFILYGVAMTGIGLLTLTGNTVAMDSFGPISDNANGIGEMSGMEGQSRQIMADLDAVGNTTKAITKGIAIASAVIAAVSLFGSFITDVTHIVEGIRLTDPAFVNPLENGIRVSQPIVFVGMLIGGAIPWLFSSFTINAVGRAAGLIVSEVRAQFRIPGIMEGTKKPDYRQVVGICTAAAQKELVSLALLSIVVPVIVGFVLQVEALGGLLAGAILSGQLLAVFMATAGGAWDNAKKHIEDGHYGGKGSEAHKAGVVGDTVGDPLKDTAGPALNPMIKVVNLVSLIVAPIVVQYPRLTLPIILFVLVLLAATVWAIREQASGTAHRRRSRGGSGADCGGAKR